MGPETMPTDQYNKANRNITGLKPGQVFVFGANTTGFHGAGSAGMAMRGEAKNTWRNDPAFLRAKSVPPGHADRIGKWAVYGVARGFQKGREGMSYAIETIVRPGQLRSTPLSAIKAQFGELLAFAKANPQYEILMTPVGCGYAGYTASEMKIIWDEAVAQAGGLPENVKNTEGLYHDNPEFEMT
jgi:hypothetical protein